MRFITIACALTLVFWTYTHFKRSPVKIYHGSIPQKVKTIPQILLLNYNDNFLQKPNATNRYIRDNVLEMIRIHPNWSVVFDDDTQCANKIKQLDFLGDSTLHWFTTDNQYGKYRSDLCRLVQLYISGGLYIDNDVQLLEPWDLIYAAEKCDFITVKSRPPIKSTFQAIIAANAQNEIVREALLLHRKFAEKKLNVKGMLGPDLLYMAIQNKKHVCLLQEGIVSSLMKNRHRRGSCDLGVFKGKKVIAYERVVEYGDHNDLEKKSCFME